MRWWTACGRWRSPRRRRGAPGAESVRARREGVRPAPPAPGRRALRGEPPGGSGGGARPAVRDGRGRPARRSRPAVRLGAAALRAGRPDRRPDRGRAGLGLHGRLLRATGAADPRARRSRCTFARPRSPAPRASRRRPRSRSALAKLAEALGPEVLADLADRVDSATDERAVATVSAVRRAVGEHERLGIEYYAAPGSRDHRAEIDPEHVFVALGNWYVVAWDHLSDAERLFRVDRITQPSRRGRGSSPRGLRGAGAAPVHAGRRGRQRHAATAAGRPLGRRVLRDGARNRAGGRRAQGSSSRRAAWSGSTGSCSACGRMPRIRGAAGASGPGRELAGRTRDRYRDAPP